MKYIIFTQEKPMLKWKVINENNAPSVIFCFLSHWFDLIRKFLKLHGIEFPSQYSTKVKESYSFLFIIN